MTVLYSPYNNSLTVRFSHTVEYKLFPWFDEEFSAYARLNSPLCGISQPMQRLFPGYVPADHESVKVFAATLDFTGPSDDVRRIHEASVYRKELAKLWGIAVPRMYGFFIGHCEDTPVACLLLELCLGGPTLLFRDSEEFVRLAMQNDNKVMLVDFSRAVVHRCNSAMPVYRNQRFCLDRKEIHEDDERDCGGLMAMARERMRAVSVAS
ncbi:hypothetical protein EDB86DRAFT_2835382 [Lactarius hatsudake]|nr:hypothetical protein EDB86DRAFT_2835382 [Lactarius hatsudake]